MTNRLIVGFGESNAGGVAANSLAAAWEVAARAELQMWNVTTEQFEPLDIGTNNNLDHFGLTSSTHGWELGLANAARQGQFDDEVVHYVQTGQGSSTLAQWSAVGTYWSKFLARTTAAMAAITADSIDVWISLGINDATSLTTADAFETGMTELIGRIKTQLPGCTIYLAKLPTDLGGLRDDYNARIDTIVGGDAAIYAISVVNLDMVDALHWSYRGLKDLAMRFVDQTQSKDSLTGRKFTWNGNNDVNRIKFTGAGQHAAASELLTVDDGFDVYAELASDGVALVVVIDNDVDEINWNAGVAADLYYLAAYMVGTSIYWAHQNNSVQGSADLGATFAWIRFSNSGTDLLLQTSTDGGATWTTRYTRSATLNSGTDVRLKCLSASGANNALIWGGSNAVVVVAPAVVTYDLVIQMTTLPNVYRDVASTVPVDFTWPVADLVDADFTTKEKEDGTALQGVVSFLYTKAGLHWYRLAYNAADVPSVAGTVGYVFGDGTYDRSLSVVVSVAGGGSGEVTSFSASALQQLAAIKIALLSPVDQKTKTLTIVQNKDYTSASVIGPVRFAITQTGVVAGDVVRLGWTLSSGETGEATGVVVDEGGTLYGDVELTKEDHTNIPCDEYGKYEFEHISGSGKVSPLLPDKKLIVLPAHPN